MRRAIVYAVLDDGMTLAQACRAARDDKLGLGGSFPVPSKTAEKWITEANRARRRPSDGAKLERAALLESRAQLAEELRWERDPQRTTALVRALREVRTDLVALGIIPGPSKDAGKEAKPPAEPSSLVQQLTQAGSKTPPTEPIEQTEPSRDEETDDPMSEETNEAATNDDVGGARSLLREQASAIPPSATDPPV